jgi:hypothetical protein
MHCTTLVLFTQYHYKDDFTMNYGSTEFVKCTSICGVYWTKFECISDKIHRILTNDEVCASPARALLARGKTQKFPIIFICGSPHTPRRKAEHLKGRKFLVLLPPLHSSKKARRCILAFLQSLRPPFLRRLRRREALSSPCSVVIR